MYDLNRMASDLAEADFFADEIRGILSQLESSSGCVVVDDLPAAPLETLGLTVEKHIGSTSIISYNMQLFALLKLSGLYHQTSVYESLRRYLANARPSSRSFFVEISLYTLLLEDNADV